MRYFAGIILLTCVTTAISGQNLVPNPDFEQYDLCPNGDGQLYQAIGWVNPTQSSPDYYNTCSGAIALTGVPSNWLGYQVPHSGDGYTGIFGYNENVPDGREYLQIPLLAPLEANQTYLVSFYVSLADISSLAINDLEIHLSDTLISWFEMTNIPNINPSIRSKITLNNFKEWILISGCYAAKGGESYMTIGNFDPDNSTTLIKVPTGSLQKVSAYYIDDVSVIKVEQGVELGNDTTLCAGESLILDITSPGAEYIWQDSSRNPVYEVSRSGEYRVTKSNGCFTDSDSITVYKSESQAGSNRDTTLCTGDEMLLDVSRPSGIYQWQDNSMEPIYLVTEPGDYHVTITDRCGTLTENLRVDYRSCTVTIHIPSAFTPNADGVNDFFGPVFYCDLGDCRLDQYSLTIYNRWGKVVFHTNDQTKPWDGRSGPGSSPGGVYVYLISYIVEGKKTENSGTVSVWR